MNKEHEQWKKKNLLNNFLQAPFSDRELMHILHHCQTLPDNWALKIVQKLKEREELAASNASLMHRTIAEKLRDIAEIVECEELDR